MNSESPYYRILSLIIVGVLCWNFAGTLVSGLIVNHLHTHSEGSYCEISFCSCSVEDRQKICTCHHPELQQMNHDHEGNMANNHHKHSSEHEEAGFCYFSADHNQAQSIPTVLVEFNKLNAVYTSVSTFINSHNRITFRILHNAPLLTGVVDDLLKPPRVS